MNDEGCWNAGRLYMGNYKFTVTTLIFHQKGHKEENVLVGARSFVILLARGADNYI